MFGCDHCIPKGLVAAPSKSEEFVDGFFEASIDWIADTGSAQYLPTGLQIIMFLIITGISPRIQSVSQQRMVKVLP